MAQRTVLIRTSPERAPIQKEWIMDAVVRPGQLVEYASSTRIQVLSATIDPTVRVVVESGTVPIDGTYASGDMVPFVVPSPGDEIYAYATSTALGTIAAGNLLVSDGAGFLVLFDTTATIAAGEAIAVALEAKVIAANSLEQLRVEVL